MHYIFWIILWFLSYFVSKKQNLYIFWSINWKTFSWNSKAMFLYLQKNNPKIEIFYHTRDKNLIEELEEKFPLLSEKIIYINSFKWFYNILKAKYIFTDSDMYDVSPGLSYQMWNFNVVNWWHWEWFKKLGFMWDTKYTKVSKILTKYIKNYFQNIVKLWTVSSQFMKKHFNSWHATNKYQITGLARNDIFFRNDLEIFNVKTLFNLEKFNKIILYAPTWRQDSRKINPFSDVFLNSLNIFLKKENTIFIIKSHQNSDRILTKKYSNIIDISKEKFDIQELIKYSDVMITDYSSIFVDYLLLDRPILFYAYDYEYYKDNLVNLIDTYENCVIKDWICYDENTLFRLLQNENIFNNKNYKTDFLKLKNLYHKNQNWWYCENILKSIDCL